MASLVVPGIAETMAAFRPAKKFKMLLLPTLGGPTIAALTPDLTSSPLLSAFTHEQTQTMSAALLKAIHAGLRVEIPSTHKQGLLIREACSASCSGLFCDQS